MKWVWGKMNSDESGYVLVMAIFVLVVTSIIAVGLAVVGANEFELSGRTKLMDTAYQIAEAGISRACVYIKDNPSVVLDTGGGAHDYRGDGLAQWESGTQDFGVSNWKGTYSSSIWQSELAPTNPYYKVIVSTGSITKNDRTTERTIETRIVTGPTTTDYDSSFDYCIYNGFYGVGKPGDDDYEAPTENGVWPYADPTNQYWIGTMEIDGVTPFNNHSPKGAIYTRGSINIPTQGIAGARIHGNIVATKNITLATSWNIVDLDVLGIVVDNLDNTGKPVLGQGNVVAGLSGTGNVNLNVVNNLETRYTAGLQIVPGWVVAPQDVTININNNITLGPGNMPSIAVGGNIGGIIAGRDVIIKRTENKGGQKNCVINNIFCGRTLDVKSEFGGVSLNQVSAGGESIGCHIENTAGSVSTGAIYSQGRVEIAAKSNSNFQVGDIYAGLPTKESVNINAATHGISVGNVTAQGGVTVIGASHSPTMGSITAGIDNNSSPAGNGVTINVTSSICAVGAITAVGKVDMDITYSGSGLLTSSMGNIWSGADADVTLNLNYWALTLGDISAAGKVTVSNTVGAVGCILLGRISAEGNVSVTDIVSNAGAYYNINGIKSGGNVSFVMDGGGAIAACSKLEPWDRGPGTPFRRWDALTESDDSINAKGTIFLNVKKSWSMIWLLKKGLIPMDLTTTNAYAGSTITKQVDVWFSTIAAITEPPNPNTVALRNWTPGVDTPSTPASPWTTGPTSGYPTGSPGDTEGWFKKQTPKVDQSLLLLMADRLETPVQFLEPNWGYFAEAAAADEGVICTNPDCRRTNPKGATTCYNCGQTLVNVAPKKTHILKDTGYPADGDNDGVAGNHEIKFLWDASNAQNYSSNETIYQDDPNVKIVMDVNWGGDAAASFKGTLVTKGGIAITDNGNGGWHFKDTQELNLISGKSIKKTAGGWEWLKNDKITYHWWARYNIDLADTVWTLAKKVDFYGSFTAGNRLVYTIGGVTSFWKISNWHWTRWGLESRAWLPAFTVLSYKEI